MRGLLVKDLRLMLVQKTNLILMMIIGVALMFMEKNVMFGVCYITVLISCISIGTVNYDAFDDGMAFLMTLPIRRKTYVIEKYLFIILTGVVSALVLGGIGLIFIEKAFTPAAIENVLGGVLSALLTVAAMTSLMLPVQIKFGAEKSRIVIGLIAGLMFAASAVMSRFSSGLGEIPVQLSENQVLLLVAGGIVLITVISMLISIKILEKKEY